MSVFAFLSAQLHPLELPVLLLSLAATVWVLVENRPLTLWRRHPIRLAAGGAFLVLLGGVLSVTKAVDLEASLKVLGKWMEVFFLGLIVFMYARGIKRQRLALATLCLAYVSIAIMGVASNWNALTDSPGYQSLHSLPAQTTVLLLAAGLPYLERHWWGRTTALILVVISAIALSRSAWIGLGLVSLAYARDARFTKDGRRTLAFILVCGALLSVLALVFVDPLRDAAIYQIKRTAQTSSASNMERIQLASLALSLFFENPWTGVGFGNFPSHLSASPLAATISAEKAATLAPHNVFLELGAEGGVLALAGIVFLTVAISLALRSPRNREVRCEDRLRRSLLYQWLMIFTILLFGFISGPLRLELGLFIGLTFALMHHKVGAASCET